MELHLKISGWLMIALAFTHVTFPRYFNWKEQMNLISLLNKQIMYVHTFFVALTVLLMGTLCLAAYHDLCTTALGKQVSLGLGIFWTARLLIQLVGYSSKLWKGKKFETAVHVVFLLIWAYLSSVFITAYLHCS